MEKGSKATGWGEGLLGCGEGVEGGEGGSAAALRAEESPSSPGMKGNAMLRTCWQYKIRSWPYGPIVRIWTGALSKCSGFEKSNLYPT